MDIVALFTLFFTIAAFCVALFQSYKHNMSEPASRQIYIERLKSPRYDRIYKSILQRGLRAVDWAFGETRPFFPSGYVVCIGISFIYSVAGFVGAWSIGGPGHLGETNLLPEHWPIDIRLYFTILLFVACGLLYQFSAHALIISRFVYVLANRFMGPGRITRSAVAYSWI